MASGFLFHVGKPASRLGAVVIAVHGLSGAALDYEPLGSHLAALGIVTYAPELRGQGNDPGQARRGDLTSLEVWYGDLRTFITMVRSDNPGIPLFLYGESMGAALLTRFLAQEPANRQPAGLILASPVVRVPNDPGLWRRLVFHFFCFVSPSRRIDVSKYTERRDENDPKHWVTRDAAHRRWFDASGHKITSFTFRFFKCLFDLFGGCFEAAPKLRAPTLVIYAAHDVFIPAKQVESFFQVLGPSDKELHFFRNSYHLLLHDIEKPLALSQIERWILAHLPK